jgi:hypothetical protein
MIMIQSVYTKASPKRSRLIQNSPKITQNIEIIRTLYNHEKPIDTLALSEGSSLGFMLAWQP